MKDRQALRGAIAEALSAVRRGDEGDALQKFERLVGTTWHTLRDTVLELAQANVEMLLTVTDSRGDDDLVITLADDEGDPTSIDDLDPSHRTATRILLALAAGRPDDAQAQWEIAAGAQDPETPGQVLAHTVSWTMEMIETCEAAAQPVPRWLRPVLAA
jgi:hypothetical protein